MSKSEQSINSDLISKLVSSKYRSQDSSSDRQEMQDIMLRIYIYNHLTDVILLTLIILSEQVKYLVMNSKCVLRCVCRQTPSQNHFSVSGAHYCNHICQSVILNLLNLYSCMKLIQPFHSNF